MKNTGREMLQTVVMKVIYEFSTHHGYLYMDEGCCCDMTECIEFFQMIDPDVTHIFTFAGNKADTKYRLTEEGWCPFTVTVEVLTRIKPI
jgi:DNA helicase TIP49 (TBP-interacting protein)